MVLLTSTIVVINRVHEHDTKAEGTALSLDHCLPQGVFRCPQTPNINPYSTYKMALLCVLYILQDAQFISAGANSALDKELA